MRKDLLEPIRRFDSSCPTCGRLGDKLTCRTRPDCERTLCEGLSERRRACHNVSVGRRTAAVDELWLQRTKLTKCARRTEQGGGRGRGSGDDGMFEGWPGTTMLSGHLRG